MTIFGFVLSATDLGLLGAGGLCLGWYIAHRLSIWRNRHNRFAVANAAFREAFGDALLQVAASSDTSSTIIFQNHNGHLAAIVAFHPYVAWYRRRSFERACEEYSLQANIQKAKGPLEGLVFEGMPEAQAQRAALLASIKKLISHASAT